MGLLVPKPRLEGGETSQWHRLANREQGDKAVGGRLDVTTKRVVFTASRLEGGSGWEVPRGDVSAVAVQAPGPDSGPGGIRHQVRLELRNGDTELFVIRDPEGAVKELQGLLEG